MAFIIALSEWWVKVRGRQSSMRFGRITPQAPRSSGRNYQGKKFAGDGLQAQTCLLIG